MLINPLWLFYDAGLKIGLLHNDASIFRIFSRTDLHISLFMITEAKETLL